MLLLMLAGLYGLVKAFVGMSMSDYQGECPQHMIPRTKRSIMRERGKKIRLTAEFGRPYKCIVDSFKSYKLDDWLHFLATFSLYVLQEDMLHPSMQAMWQKLRQACLLLFCPTHCQVFNQPAYSYSAYQECTLIANMSSKPSNHLATSSRLMTVSMQPCTKLKLYLE
ncbi:TPA: hypothetical protein ACH3X1_016704 [Trebouxia sp. C0004]